MNSKGIIIFFLGSPFLTDVALDGFLNRYAYIKFVKYTGLAAFSISLFELCLGLWAFFMFFKVIISSSKGKLTKLKVVIELLKSGFFYLFTGLLIFRVFYTLYEFEFYLVYYLSILLICFYFQIRFIKKLSNKYLD